MQFDMQVLQLAVDSQCQGQPAGKLLAVRFVGPKQLVGF